MINAAELPVQQVIFSAIISKKFGFLLVIFKYFKK
jgi:hypothetical protein